MRRLRLPCPRTTALPPWLSGPSRPATSCLVPSDLAPVPTTALHRHSARSDCPAICWLRTRQTTKRCWRSKLPRVHQHWVGPCSGLEGLRGAALECGINAWMNHLHPPPFASTSDLATTGIPLFAKKTSKKKELHARQESVRLFKYATNVKPPPLRLKINEFPLQYDNQAKILGVWIQNDLKWNKNFLETSIKINRKLYMLRLLKRFGFTLPELVTVYKGYIRPLLEYADVVWHSSLTCQQSHQLEQLQRRACRIIMGCEFISYSDALQKCDLVTLSCRRRNHCQLFAERLSKSICTADLLPPTRHETHSRNLRNFHYITQLRIKTSRYKNSPIPHSIDLLNEHSQH